MTNTTLGILAHVDAGKTTLAEAILYKTGSIRKAGRVDFGNTALDTHELERERGITIFSGQAQYSSGDRKYTILDTPGHVDFSAATENTMSVMDYAILVISGAEGVQSHSKTLWKLLEVYSVPVFIFVTKMDYSHRSREELIAGLKENFGEQVIDLVNRTDGTEEEIAFCREDMLEKYLGGETITDRDITDLIKGRCLFPVFFGSGLKMDGVDEFIAALDRYTFPSVYPDDFGMRVFKVTFDDKGARLTHVKVTGGRVIVRDTIGYNEAEEKISQIRVYSGSKFTTADSAGPGDICTLTGLSALHPGDGVGREHTVSPVLEPVMTYSMTLPEDVSPDVAVPKLKQLEEEDPLLKITWVAHLKEISVSLLGKVQAEILKSLISERFGFDVTIGKGRVLYKETIDDTVEGIGHYEPLRHYAEVHLLLEKGERGSGITISSRLSEDILDRNWQRLIITHIKEKQHLGVLTGSPLTDVKITLCAGRAHLKHTEAGDFRQATYRAIRQGLMQAKSRLLEPYYNVTIELPTELTGRAITDIRQRSGEIENPVTQGSYTILKGYVPVAEFGDYASELASYTSGRGRLFTDFAGYDYCHNEADIISAASYNPESDLANSPDSVFCAHGAGFTVKWNEVKSYMHLDSVLEKKPQAIPTGVARRYHIDDKELEAIMRKEFGTVKYELYKPKPVKKDKAPEDVYIRDMKSHIIVDGYNCIFAWEELKALADYSLEEARNQLMDILCNYSAYTKHNIILVFDAYKVSGNTGEKINYRNIHIVYTKEHELGDSYIEKLIADIGKNDKVRVVTSDGLIQLSAVRYGVLRMSAQEFEAEIKAVNKEIGKFIEELNGG